jgi:peptidyl-tRNA hydrolase
LILSVYDCWNSLKVGQIVSFYKIPLKQVLVVYDDLDLPFGKLRLLPKGGHGGHNGYNAFHSLSGLLMFSFVF